MVRVQVTVTDDTGTVVQAFERTCQPTAAALQRAAEQAMGWLQAWSAQVTGEQFAADARHAEPAAGLRRIA